MIAAQIKSKRQFTVPDLRQYGVQSYGEGNDFPQVVAEIAGASTTAVGCIRIFAKFIAGGGFAERSVGSIRVGVNGETCDDVRRWIAKDFAKFGGFAIHLNYNLLGEVVSVTPVPFECFRLGLPDELTKEVAFIKFHPDWGRRLKEKRWRSADMVTYRNYKPESAVSELIEDGVVDCTGQILYFNGDDIRGEMYGLPIFVSALTDMRAEEALSNVTARNVCSNFLPAGMLVDIKAEEQDEVQLQERQAQLDKFQGDENTGAAWYVQVRDKTQVPEFVKMSGENYDKAFTATEEALPDRIGRAFNQPPILRAEDIGAGFGSDLVENSYKFYNSVTSGEREVVTAVLSEVFNKFAGGVLQGRGWDIVPLAYGSARGIAEQKGADVAQAVIELVKDSAILPAVKERLFTAVYGIDEATARELAYVAGGTQ